MFSPVRTILKKEYKKEPYSFSHLPSSNAFLLLKEIEYHSWPNSKTEWLKTSSPFPAYPSRKRGLVLALKSLFFSSLAHKIREDWPSLLPSFFLLLLGVTKELDEERPPVSNLYPTPYEGALARLTPKGQAFETSSNSRHSLRSCFQRYFLSCISL